MPHLGYAHDPSRAEPATVNGASKGVSRAPNPRDVRYADPDEAVDRPGPAPLRDHPQA
jgi:hypothetical protein